MANTAPPPDPFAFAAAHPDTVWMSQNTNSLPTSPEVEAAILRALKSGAHHKYPQKAGIPGLADAVLADLGLAGADLEVSFSSGSVEGHYVLHKALWQPGDEVLASDPSFYAIHEHIRLWGGVCTDLPIYEGPYKLTPDQVQAAITPKTKGLLLIDPLNPLGTGFDAAEVKAFAEIAVDHDLWLIHDVAYRDFSDGHTPATRHAPEHTIINYTFSKSTGLAGLRIGATVAPPEVIAAMKKWDPAGLGINILAQVAAKAALETKKHWLPGMLRTARRNRDAIKAAVDRVDGAFVPGHPSRANMLCIDVADAGVKPDDVQQRLLYDHRVFVRSGSYVSPRFGSRFVRVSFTVPEAECDRFCEAFPQVVEGLRA